ncbi:PLA2G4F isoform 4 [Pongo abelii]|uniref:PLA2G4F isoform 4 n=1 Tax=Pongo abelii TaxID=9601 RepID=A0A2J8S5R4_PONAB|nr:PLA2G4F isoform 4 [Pongo abelii]
MLWALWPRWLAGKMLPLLGAVLLQKREKKGPLWRHWRYPKPTAMCNCGCPRRPPALPRRG